MCHRGQLSESEGGGNSHEENALLQALDTADLLAQERHLDNVEVLWQESCGQDD